ncbi:hypothetical protein [Pseudoalteromonas sp. MMG022]|uniref:hypothetical protein n=1 Tax=Pseudoalteromonas sp. MMG022 TaxID=2909978 RepID=UPI001F3EA63D|nr:hypothetical protein [Pseudoalteromonas sp. MMG022]MCF6436915.1 hypothetical protein [Pseudoalteromonas sp. MMG022]
MLTRYLIMGCLIASSQIVAKCNESGYRSFDFWLGHWQVFTKDGQLAGENTISKSHDGCVVKEVYSTKSGFSGESLNIYDINTNTWHQTWVDNSGLLLRLDGGLNDGRMILSGARSADSQKQVIERITWTPNEDGTVRQLWERKEVTATQWQTVFDGLYKPAKADKN